MSDPVDTHTLLNNGLSILRHSIKQIIPNIFIAGKRLDFQSQLANSKGIRDTNRAKRERIEIKKIMNFLREIEGVLSSLHTDLTVEKMKNFTNVTHLSVLLEEARKFQRVQIKLDESNFSFSYLKSLKNQMRPILHSIYNQMSSLVDKLEGHRTLTSKLTSLIYS